MQGKVGKDMQGSTAGARSALASFLQSCRRHAGKSQEGASALGGLSTGHISKVEAGKVPVTANVLRWYIKKLDAPSERAWQLFRAAGGTTSNMDAPEFRAPSHKDDDLGKGFRVLREGLRVTLSQGQEDFFTESAHIEFLRSGVRLYKDSPLHMLETQGEQVGDRGYKALFGCYVEHEERFQVGYISRIRFAEHTAVPGRLHELAYTWRNLDRAPGLKTNRLIIPPWVSMYSHYEVAFSDTLPRSIRLAKYIEGKKKGSTDFGEIEVAPLVTFDIHNTESPGLFSYHLHW